MYLFSNDCDFSTALHRTVIHGYTFIPQAISPECLFLLEREVEKLTFEVGDHVLYPIWKGTEREVRQVHARSYHMIVDGAVPVAADVALALSRAVTSHLDVYPALTGWVSTEAGYQLYRGPTDFISPHRDRRNDRLLSATITIRGSAWVQVLEPVGDPNDYTNLTVVDQFLTEAGTLMLLRAPGLGTGGQVIHEVLSPINGDRVILNLRSRDALLKPPSSY